MSSEIQNRIRVTSDPLRNSPLLGIIATYSSGVKRIIIFGQLYLVAMAVAAVLTVMFALSLPLNPAPVVIGLVTYSVYVGDRISDIRDEPEATENRVRFMAKHETLFSISSALAYGIALTIAVLGGPIVFAITLLPGLFWMLYASDWIPSIGIKFRQLKQVFIVNSMLVAFAWAFSIVFLPLAFTNHAVTTAGIVLFSYFFITMFISAELSNIRDITDDTNNGVATVPNTFGIRRTRHLLYLLELVLVGGTLVSYYGGILSTGIAVGIIVGLGFSMGLNSLVGRVTEYGRIAILEETKHILVGVVAFAFAFI